MFDHHGYPRTLQSVRGKEFYGEVKTFCEKRKIEMIKSRTYHPQSQGKVERSHTSLKIVSATFLLVCFVCPKERTCETRKNVFYFSSKALFDLEIIKF